MPDMVSLLGPTGLMTTGQIPTSFPGGTKGSVITKLFYYSGGFRSPGISRLLSEASVRSLRLGRVGDGTGSTPGG